MGARAGVTLHPHSKLALWARVGTAGLAGECSGDPPLVVVLALRRRFRCLPAAWPAPLASPQLPLQLVHR